MDGLLRDLRFGLRGLLRTPGFTAAAVLALALGIGATTAIFSVVHAVLLRSFGWGEETRLVSVYRLFAGIGTGKGRLSIAELYDLREARFFESVGSFNGATAALQRADGAERLPVARVTSGFFSVLGVRPQFGRVFGPDEEMKGNDGVALVSAPAFRRRFGGDPTSVGRSVALDGRSYAVIGVLPEGFSYGGAHDFFIPYGFTQTQRFDEPGAHYLDVVAKLRPGVSLQAASKALEEHVARMSEAHPRDYPAELQATLKLEPLRERFVASSRQPILVLFGAVLLVLLIACGNVANLLLARSAAREREFALRAVLVVAQVAVCLFLLTGAGLLLRSFGRLLHVSPGFEPRGAIAAELAPAGPSYADPDARERYFERALRVASEVPGVTAAGGINLLPTRAKFGQTYFIEGYELRPGEAPPTDEFRCVLPGYFSAMRQGVVAGRDFSMADDARAPPVVLVNEAWVRRYLPGRDVVGRRLQIDTDRARNGWRTIVGVVADAREHGLDQPVPPVFYLAAAQEPPDWMTLVVRGQLTPAALRSELSRIDPAQPLDRVLPLEDVLAASLAPRRFPLQLLGV